MELNQGDPIKKMADALRRGAKMLTEVCPVCNSPLFDVKGEMRCVVCDKPVVVVRDEEDIGRAVLPFLSKRLDEVLVAKMEELINRLSKAVEIDEIYDVCRALDYVLTLIKKNEEVRGGEVRG